VYQELSGHRALPQNSVSAQGEYDLNSKFSIHASQWFGWQMNPGYFGERCVPYFSPIYVTRLTPLKTGKGILEMDFFNACYAEGVQNFDGTRLKVLPRAENYLIGQLLGHDSEVRSAIISQIEATFYKCDLSRSPRLNTRARRADSIIQNL
jgi:hypothetical protein